MPAGDNPSLIDHRDPFSSQLSATPWLFFQDGYTVDTEEPLESLMAIGNGYLCMRGILEENPAGTRAGTFFAGVFDKGRAQVPELVNAPNPIYLRFYADDTLLDPSSVTTLENRRILDLRQGLLYRRTVFLDERNRRFLLSSLRFISLADPHLIVIRCFFCSLDADATIQVEDAIDAAVANRDTVAKEKNIHYRVLEGSQEDTRLSLLCQTIDRRIQICYRTELQLAEERPIPGTRQSGFQGNLLSHRFNLNLRRNIPVCLTKWIAIHTSRHIAKDRLPARTQERLEQGIELGFDRCLERHRQVWEQRWRFTDIELLGDERVQWALRLNLYHLMIVGPVRDKNVSIGARTLTGEGYGGHVFWDTEIFVLPFFIFTDPRVARNLLLYRYRRLNAARQLATEHGFDGAMFPWESADIGRDVTPTLAVDFDGSVVRVKTMDQEHHITADVSYGCALYADWSGDADFFVHYGAEIMLETARYWASRVEWDRNLQRYSIRYVIGPDEFHEEIDNNAYTNFLARWNLETGADWYHRLQQDYPEAFAQLGARLKLRPEEPERWRDIARQIYLPMDEERRLIEQFEGYFQREDFRVTQRNHNYLPVFATPLSTARLQPTQALKQADVIMIHTLFPDAFPKEWIEHNYDYYEPRTTHSSSLSPAMYSIVASYLGRPVAAWRYFLAALFVDLNLSGRSAADGIHAASAGGIWQNVIFGFAGIKLNADGKLAIYPRLPRHWQKLTFYLHCQGERLRIELGQDEVELCLLAERSKERLLEPDSSCGEQAPYTVTVEDRLYRLEGDRPIRITLRKD
ncbi:MAG: glycosyl hydrolase family 65 protein [Candidatus Competibacteraceae bacterium]